MDLNETTNTSGGIFSQCATRTDLHGAKPLPFTCPIRAVASWGYTAGDHVKMIIKNTR